MKLYFSSPRADAIKAVGHKSVLLSFAVGAKKGYKAYEDTDIGVLIDSGAFSIYNSGKTVDIEKYLEFLKKLPKHWNFISLDVIPPDNPTKKELEKAVNQGIENYEYLRENIGHVLPTYHYGEPKWVLEKYCSLTDYICLGPKRGTGQSADDYYRSVFEITQDKIKVHGLANTSIPNMLNYPFYSVDSITYLRYKPHRDTRMYWAEGKLESLLYQSMRYWMHIERQVTNIWKERGLKWD